MVEKVALRIVNQMEMQKIISKSNCKYYEYALIGMIEHTITVGTMLFLGLLFRHFLHTICFVVFFLSLRKRTGGFHANKFWQCYLGTINHPNMDMNKSELRKSQKAARLLVFVETMVIAVLVFLKADLLYIGYMSMAVILCAFLMCLAKIIKQEV